MGSEDGTRVLLLMLQALDCLTIWAISFSNREALMTCRVWTVYFVIKILQLAEFVCWLVYSICLLIAFRICIIDRNFAFCTKTLYKLGFEATMGFLAEDRSCYFLRVFTASLQPVCTFAGSSGHIIQLWCVF